MTKYSDCTIWLRLLIDTVIILTMVSILYSLTVIPVNREVELTIDKVNEIREINRELIEYSNMLSDELAQAGRENNKLSREIESLKEIIVQLENELPNRSESDREITQMPSRSANSTRKVMNISAYTLAEEECGKSPDHPEYGITASGAYVKEWHTIAAGKNIPFGTRIYIPYFKDQPNGGIFTVEDRGGAIGSNNIDVYMVDKSDALSFGRRNLEVYIGVPGE